MLILMVKERTHDMLKMKLSIKWHHAWNSSLRFNYYLLVFRYMIASFTTKASNFYHWKTMILFFISFSFQFPSFVLHLQEFVFSSVSQVFLAGAVQLGVC